MPYSIADMGTVNGTIAAEETFSRDESIRLVTECLGLESGRDKALTFKECTDVNATEFKLVKGLREGGYSRPQEIDHMISKGPAVSAVCCVFARVVHGLVSQLYFLLFYLFRLLHFPYFK